jgi:hypothetical protein
VANFWCDGLLTPAGLGAGVSARLPTLYRTSWHTHLGCGLQTVVCLVPLCQGNLVVGCKGKCYDVGFCTAA